MRSTPEVFKPATGDARVVDGVLRIPVTKIILDEPQIVAAIGEKEAARMAQHMRPDGRQAGMRRGTGNEVVHRLPGQRLTALGQEQPGELVRARGKVSFDSAQLVAGDRLLDREAILEPPHPQPSQHQSPLRI